VLLNFSGVDRPFGLDESFEGEILIDNYSDVRRGDSSRGDSAVRWEKAGIRLYPWQAVVMRLNQGNSS